MENFKSFGKEMEIPFKEGYTNITGPNGSGKSNIVDAILFVLGPKSSKEIRASRLTDLIYNGGKNGSPADHCKISLVFENEDRTIPLDEDKVTFTRKVQLSDNQQGYNSYFFVNGRRSTLYEFQDLLDHGRISPDGYNIVQQGDISRIVEMGPTERRRILDEISGISEYDEEIEEAEEKKKEVSQDLERISILLDEINTQGEELEEDRKKALRFQELSDKKTEAKEKKAWKSLQNTENNITSIENDIEENKEQIGSKKKRKEEYIEERKKISNEIDDLKDKLEEKGSKKSDDLQKKINDLRLSLGRADDKKEDALFSIEKYENKREKLKTLLEEKKEDLSKKKNELSGYKDKKEEVAGKLEEIEKKKEKIEEEQSNSDGRIKGLKKESIELNNKIDEKNEKLSEKKIDLATVKDKIERVMEDIASIEEKKEDFEFEKREKEMELEDICKKNNKFDKNLNELKDEFHEKKRKEKKLRSDKRDLEDRVNRLKREYEQLLAQKEAAKSVKRGYNRAVSSILQARDKGELDGIHGTIAELADVQKDYETALKVAAGGRMQSIVVDNDSVASRAIKFLKKNDAGRATFLPLNKMRRGRPRGKALRAVKDDNAVDFAIVLVDYEEKYENVFWYVFHDTVVMKDIDSAREQMGGVRMVTLDGEKIQKSGAMVGGTLSKNMLSFSAPDRGKLDKVSLDLKSSRDNLETVEKELKKVQARIENIQDEMQDLKNETHKHQQKELESVIKRVEKDIEKKSSKLEDRKEKENELEGRKEKLERSIEHLENKVKELKDKKQSIMDKIRKISPEELSSKLEDLRNKGVELNKEFNRIDSEIDKKEDRREQLEKKIDEIKERREELKNKIKEKKSDIKKAESPIQENKKELEKIEDKEASMDEELQELRDELDDKKERGINLKHKIDSIDTEIEAKQEYIKTLKRKLSTERETLTEFKEEIDSERDYSSEELPSIKELKNTIRRCDNKMEELQPVNMRALDDYQKKKERKEDLQEEYTELENRKEELDKLINELDKKKKGGLLKVCDGINDNFGEVYEELSNGGEAHLELENNEDPFEGGLIIKARPPGKKVHLVDALSGGEKSLVSMAFIFSIQMYDPSPFYLLDEIDQNLDGLNAENVAEMISRNAETAQFIQISLRKVTLKKSDHIIGVTINDKGISDVIMKVNIGQTKETDIPEFSEVSKLKTEVK